MKKILAIDDDIKMLRCLERALKSHGYEIASTQRPEEALRILREDATFDLVLLDIKMPKKNGFEFYREMRGFRNPPVLFVTAYPRSFNAGSDDVADLWTRQFSDGNTDVIYKPLELTTLYEKVEGLIGRAGDEKEKA